MSWLRIDDGFTKHPKILALTQRQRWLWIDVLCWCARYKTKGVITMGAINELRLRPADLEAWTNACLLEMSEGNLVVHDWHVYNPSDPTSADRVKRHREKKATVTTPLHERDSNGPSRVGARARTRPDPVTVPSSDVELPAVPLPASAATAKSGNGKAGDFQKVDPFSVLGLPS